MFKGRKISGIKLLNILLLSHFVTAIAPLSLGELREAVRSRLNNKNSINNTLLPLTKAKIL